MIGMGHLHQRFRARVMAKTAQIRRAMLGDDKIGVHPPQRDWTPTSAGRHDAAGPARDRRQGDDPQAAASLRAARKVGRTPWA